MIVPMRRAAGRLLPALVLIALAAALSGYAYVRRSLPLVDGRVSVSGLSAPVEIIRDRDAIPHIFAATTDAGLFGLGYVHAQDRLWQMEIQRRTGHGRLAEVFGRAALSQDRFLRTVGFGRAAQAAWDRLPSWARQRVDAYVAGVNAFLADHRGSRLPPEFSLLGFVPEPWTGVDVIVWIKMMAWDLSANYSFELLRRDLVATIGIDRMRELMPPAAEDGLSVMEVRSEKSEPRRTETGARQDDGTLDPWPRPSDFSLLSSNFPEGLGSNNWVVDGSLTASGQPLLANDPHLSTRLPSTWYLAHLSAGDLDVIGATLPGVPAVAIGRNRDIAWGTTNVAADVEDLYRERLDAAGRFAEFGGTQEPLTITTETIAIKGAAPVSIEVRSTRHGPLVSDALNANAAAAARDARPVEPLALRWTALDPDDTTLVAFFKLNEARSWADFTAALREFIGPSQNFVYADARGHIGYYAPGRIPIRARGDGSLPIEGWTGDAEWTGWIPFDELPHLLDPPERFIVTANNRPASSGYRYQLGQEWPEPYRAQRITDLLTELVDSRSVRRQADGRSGFTPDDFARIQADTLSLHAQALLPTLLPLAHPTEAVDRQALDILRQWNHDARADLAAPAIFSAWFLQLAPAIAGDELGPRLLASYQGRFSYATRFLISALGSVRLTASANAPAGLDEAARSRTADAAPAENPWCDDGRTMARETCGEAVTAALHEAVSELTRRMGRDLSRWRYEDVHRAVFPHQLDAVAALRPLFSRSVPTGGDWSSVNVGTVSAERPFEQRSAAGYRQIIDLSPANDSWFLDAIGESGHVLSPQYDAFLRSWRAVSYKPMRMARQDIARGAIGTLHLIPK
jgi:penicillin amidase